MRLDEVERVEVAMHYAPPHTQLVGKGLARVALAPQGPHLLTGHRPACPALGGFGLSYGGG